MGKIFHSEMWGNRSDLLMGNLFFLFTRLRHSMEKRNLKQNTNIWRAVWWNVCWTIFWMEFYKWKCIWEVFGIFTDENSSKLNYISLLNISMVSRFSNSVLSVEDSCGFFFLISSEFNSFYELLDLISLNAILEVPKGNIP